MVKQLKSENNQVLSFQEITKSSGLVQKIIFTALMISIYRFGVHIPLYGVDQEALKSSTVLSSGLLGLVDMFAGGALSALSIFALGIGPYITSSIIMQLLVEVVSYLKDLQRNQGEDGRQQFQKITRYLTIALAFFQSLALARFLDVAQIAVDPGFVFYARTILVLTVTSLFVMWLGEVITEKGVGNGASLLIFVGIASKLPVMIKDTATALRVGASPQWGVISLVILFLALTVLIIYIQEGSRNLTIFGARKQSVVTKDHILPLKINPAGVLPIIFASALLFMPVQLLTFAGMSDKSVSILLRETFAALPGIANLTGTSIGAFGSWVAERIEFIFQYSKVEHSIVYLVMIVAFTFFYSSIVLNPRVIADNLKKSGNSLEGVKPGKPTADFLEKTISRIVLIGAAAIGLIAVLPIHAEQWFQVNTLGGLGSTSLIILVGVAVDVRNQILSYIQSHRYQAKSLLD